MPKKLRRVLLVLVFFIGLSLTFASPAKAQGLQDLVGAIRDAFVSSLEALQESKKQFLEAQDDVAVESTFTNIGNAGQHYVVFTTLGISESQLSQLDPETRKVAEKKFGKGVIGSMGTAIAYLYNKPANTQTYVADLMHSAHVVPKAYAQGLGFAALDPILNTWKVFRNVAYLFFVAVFLVIGFMIMFRQRISGNTVVTAQQAIPHIIVALLFVTFSYAIAGLLIDVMYLIMYLLIGLFQPLGGAELIDKNFLQVGIDLLNPASDQYALGAVDQSVSIFINSIFADWGAVGDAISFIGGLTASLIVAVAIIIGVFKLFFELLKTYINIIINITAAPVMLMLGALPGQNTFWTWMKGLIGNLAAFPTVLVLLIMYQMMVKNVDVVSGGFMPPYMIGQGNAGALMVMVGIGIILVIPEVVQEVKKKLGAGEGLLYTLGMKAIDNALAANQYAAPFTLGGAGALAGAARGGYVAYRDTPGGVSWRDIRKGMWMGAYDASGRHRGGAAPSGTRWYGRGRTLARKIDQAREGKLFDPDILTRQQEEIKKILRERGGEEEEQEAPKPATGGEAI